VRYSAAWKSSWRHEIGQFKSFNVRGEPIVCTPHDAINTFVNTGIDAITIGNYIVTEKPHAVDYEAGMRRSIELESSPLVM
ncbi:MAG: hypothetical protein GXY44_11715, partial [Phycisphaerales bacterium]|nr:hypothetical protein [Phycisphaerales bacterium]